MQDQVHELQKSISQKDSKLIEEKNSRLQLEEQIRQQLENTRRIEEMHALEQKVNSDEKYIKMRDQYNKLREEHILVLRREGEIKKQLGIMKQNYEQLLETKNKLEIDYKKLKDECEQMNFNFNSKISQFETLDNEILQMRKINDNLKKNIEKLTSLNQTLENTMKSMTNELVEKKQILQKEKSSWENQSKTELTILRFVEDLNQLIETFKQNQLNLQEALVEKEKIIQETSAEKKKIIQENELKKKDFQSDIEKLREYNKTIEVSLKSTSNDLTEKIVTLENEVKRLKDENENLLKLIEQTKNEKSILEENLTQCNMKIEKLRTVNELLEKQLEQLNEKHSQDKEQYELFYVNAAQTKAHIEENLAQMNTRHNELNDTIIALTSERNDYKTSVLAMSERIKEIENEKKVPRTLDQLYKQTQDEKVKIDKQLATHTSEFESKLKEYELNRKDLLDQNREHEENLIDLVHEKEVLETKVEDLQLTAQDLAKKLHFINESQKLLQINHTNILENLKESYKLSLLDHCINHIYDGIERSNDSELLYCKSGAEYLLSRLKSSLSTLTTTHDYWKKHQSSEGALLSFLNECVSLSHYISDVVVHGKATSNLVQDADKGVELADSCREVGTSSIEIFDTYKRTISPESFENDIKDLTRKLNRLITNTTNLLPKITDISKEELGDLVEKELQNTHETIDEAVRQIQALLEKSRITDTGVKLEVNSKILDTCGELMQAIRQLIIRARDLQKEIVSQGRGTATAKEFYTKNHKWTEGLVSAAKNVGLNAKVLIESADHLLSGNGKFEEIIACSNEIASATAQLVAASNVKADRESKNREALTHASKQVTAATAQVVATAKSGAITIEEKSTLDFSSYSLHKTKRAEMDAQVKVLELEKQLEQAKVSLYTLRKRHYQLAGEDGGWDANGTNIRS
ncbi:unnamed protein product [Didymodactylos carnosus]|uniref:I/LWEQ domain-containing protein n=1 Tax=Didymodactylos carnosus TaxID=1234261 RepID=A0A8S2DDG1_9BILA|nr:unnamed protein product [Didymodactylos carnosus]CAF3716630.1 unnamed protein product [Didymodactylos carnosus]